MTLRHLIPVLASLTAVLAVACAAQDDMSEEDVLKRNTLNGAGAPGLILTFDDGPVNYAAPVTYTSIIDGSKSTVASSADFAEWLSRKGVKATFFMVGRPAAAAPQLVERIARAGHTIASHTYGHITDPAFANLSADKQSSELTRADEILFKTGAFDRNLLKNDAGKGVLFLRTPGGSWGPITAARLNESFGTRYVGAINWDIGGDAPAADWHCWSRRGAKTVEQCTQLYREDIARHGDKGIVLLHDIHSKSALMSMRLVEEHLKAGKRFYSLADAPKVKQAMNETVGLRSGAPAPGITGDSDDPTEVIDGDVHEGEGT